MNAIELNRVISDEIHKVRAGKSKPERAVAVSRLAGNIIAIARLEHAHARFLNRGGPGTVFFANGQGKKALPRPAIEGKSRRTK